MTILSARSNDVGHKHSLRPPPSRGRHGQKSPTALLQKPSRSPSTSSDPIPVQASLESIMDYILAHEEYSPHGRSGDDEKLKDQPEFDKIAYCGITKDQEKELWAIEARSLLETAQNPDIALRFDDAELFGKVSLSGYERLSVAAKKIIWAIMISRLDNEVTALENRMNVTNSNSMRRNRQFLEDGLEEEPKYLTG